MGHEMPGSAEQPKTLAEKLNDRLRQAEQGAVAASKDPDMEPGAKKTAFNEVVAVKSAMRALRENGDDRQAAEKWLEEQKEIGGGEESVYARAIEILHEDA